MAANRTVQLKMALVAGFVTTLIMLKPAICHAQAEIDPDHYDTITQKSVRSAPPKAKPNRNANNSQSRTSMSKADRSKAKSVCSPGTGPKPTSHESKHKNGCPNTPRESQTLSAVKPRDAR